MNNTAAYKFSCRHVFSSLGAHLGVELQSHGNFLAFEELPEGFPKKLHLFTFPPAVYEGASFSISWLTPVVVFLLKPS